MSPTREGDEVVFYTANLESPDSFKNWSECSPHLHTNCHSLIPLFIDFDGKDNKDWIQMRKYTISHYPHIRWLKCYETFPTDALSGITLLWLILLNSAEVIFTKLYTYMITWLLWPDPSTAPHAQYRARPKPNIFSQTHSHPHTYPRKSAFQSRRTSHPS